MNHKAAIKIFKRKDIESSIHTTSPQTETAAPALDEQKAERHSRREMVNTISNWVTERRERNRTEEIQALRKVFGGATPLLS